MKGMIGSVLIFSKISLFLFLPHSMSEAEEVDYACLISFVLLLRPEEKNVYQKKIHFRGLNIQPQIFC